MRERARSKLVSLSHICYPGAAFCPLGLKVCGRGRSRSISPRGLHRGGPRTKHHTDEHAAAGRGGPSAHLLTASAAPRAGSRNVGLAQQSCAYRLQPRWSRPASITASPDPPGSSSRSPVHTWQDPRGRSPGHPCPGVLADCSSSRRPLYVLGTHAGGSRNARGGGRSRTGGPGYSECQCACRPTCRPPATRPTRISGHPWPSAVWLGAESVPDYQVLV